MNSSKLRDKLFFLKYAAPEKFKAKKEIKKFFDCWKHNKRFFLNSILDFWVAYILKKEVVTVNGSVSVHLWKHM